MGIVVTSTNACQLTTPVVYLTSRELGCGYYPSTGANTMPAATFTVPVDEDAGAQLSWSLQSQYPQEVHFHDSHVLSQVTIELRDTNGFLLDTNGLHWSVTLAYA